MQSALFIYLKEVNTYHIFGYNVNFQGKIQWFETLWSGALG
jgi:hypothetical protein